MGSDLQYNRDQLQRIEKESEVRILYASESGSRAWGFPSQTATLMFDLFMSMIEIGTCL